MKYKIHKVDIRMSKDKDKLEEFLNRLEGEVSAVIPHFAIFPFTWYHYIDYMWIIEKEKSERT